MKILIVIFYSMIALSTMSQAKSEGTKRSKNTHQPKYCLFFDNHTMPAVPDVGGNFDEEAFTDRIKDCGVDYLTFHARCNFGMAYYNTKIGIKQPG